MRGQFTALTLLVGMIGSALAASVPELTPACVACHGETGRSETAGVPSLGAQPSSFVLIQLYQFREKQRIIEPMNDVAKDLTDDDLGEIAEFIARLPAPSPASAAPDASRMARGQELAGKHRCGFCHNPDYSGHDHIPRLAAQREDYLVKAMQDYKSGERRGYDPAMNEVAQGISDADIPDMAYFLANWR